jgi:hypothetical protein
MSRTQSLAQTQESRKPLKSARNARTEKDARPGRERVACHLNGIDHQTYVDVTCCISCRQGCEKKGEL